MAWEFGCASHGPAGKSSYLGNRRADLVRSSTVESREVQSHVTDRDLDPHWPHGASAAVLRWGAAGLGDFPLGDWGKKRWSG